MSTAGATSVGCPQLTVMKIDACKIKCIGKDTNGIKDFFGTYHGRKDQKERRVQIKTAVMP